MSHLSMSFVSRSSLVRASSRRRKAGLALAVGAASVAAVLAPGGTATAAGGGFTQVNLVSDVPHLARITDFRVANPWGIAAGPTTPIWINNNGSATSEVYAGANGKDKLALKLVVQTPASPTGIAFNSTTAFVAHHHGALVPTLFLFNGLDGSTSAWGPTTVPMTDAIRTAFDRTNGYAGMAVANTPAGARMYVTSFRGIEVSNGKFAELSPPNAFVDPNTPAGLQPYNIAVFGSRVYVTYADLVANGRGGALSVFSLRGKLIKHLSSDKHLVAPWGMAMAPAHWGAFGGSLLVGNVGDGRISAFNPMTGAFKGQLKGAGGKPIANSGLWGLAFGNGATGTPRDLLFAAGIDNYSHGLFGMIHPN